MIADVLKKSVLQAAIQGKLTEQLPEDGDARDLLEEIRKEKAQLIREGKLKKEKPLPEITDEEIPFDIPDNWVWVRLGEIGDTNIGLTYKPSDISSKGTLVLRSGNIKNGKIDLSDNVFVKCDITESKICHIGDILMCARNGSKRLVGKAAMINDEGMSFGAFMALFRSRFNSFVLYYMQSPFFRADFDGVNTTTINQITQDNLKQRLLPLPPFSEQKRIVEIIDQLFVEIDELKEDEVKLEELQKTFPKKMKDSILQYAIQGKLTDQLPEDGDAKELLEEIRKEKAQLIREGKLKKEKPLPEITDEEIPFDIPDNWVWVRLGEIGDTNIGLTYKPSDISSKGTLVLRSGNIKNGKIDLSDNVFVKCDITESKICHIGDILMCARNGSKRLVGKAAMINDEGMSFGAFMALFRSRFNSFVLYYMQSPFFRADFDGVNTTTINQITQDNLKQRLLPLPPLSEQKRIVELLDQLLPLCDSLD